MIEEKHFKDIIKRSNNRYDLWSNFITYNNFKSISEIGVYKGDFSARLLNDCSCIEDYYMIDPWRNLSDWNKPANHNNKVFKSESFNEYKRTQLSNTDRDAFDAMELKYDAKWEEIQKQFKTLVKKYHPDKNLGSKKFEDKLKKITLAYSQLKKTLGKK